MFLKIWQISPLQTQYCPLMTLPNIFIVCYVGAVLGEDTNKHIQKSVAAVRLSVNVNNFDNFQEALWPSPRLILIMVIASSLLLIAHFTCDCLTVNRNRSQPYFWFQCITSEEGTVDISVCFWHSVKVWINPLTIESTCTWIKLNLIYI